MNKFYFFLLLFPVMFSSTCQTPVSDLQAVPNVDLKKYAGKWYDVASFPQRFQKGCHRTTAEYSLSEKGFVIVENRCNKGSLDGKQSYIKGKAFVVPGTGNAKLKVQFFWPFKGDYWIIDLAEDYSYAVVSEPGKKYLWILSRTPVMDEKVFTGITNRLKDKGFDLSKLVKTVQQ
jgi:apolipoprotein D and lipocalin family protein